MAQWRGPVNPGGLFQIQSSDSLTQALRRTQPPIFFSQSVFGR
ncbi:MAG: hypothetical protein ACTS6J_22215 [Burkholderiales bacterium]